MRAGLLNETIGIHELRKTTSLSGAKNTEYVETHKIKAYRKKLSASVGNGINASEEFISNTLVFQVRKYRFINENIHIKYGINFYKVISIDLQSDNSYLITCSKINE